MENFDDNGPKYLNDIDWNNWHHRKSIMACLVEGVYTLESDRKQNQQGDQALAPEWWKSFNFELTQVLVDEMDQSIFGAIFKSYPNCAGQGPPKYVIAFCGTVNKQENVARDYKQNLKVFLNKLKKSPRVRASMEVAMNIVQEANGPGNVLLAGHSAGSSIALLIGRKMVEEGYHLETYLFNPPFLSFPIEQIKNEILKNGLRLGKKFLTAGLVFVAKGGHRLTPGVNDPFIVLSSWAPHLFVNKSDPICSNYVGYFELQEIMESTGIWKNWKYIDTKFNTEYCVPCKYDYKYKSRCRERFKEAHGIRQWWKPDLQVEHKYYEHK